MKKTLTAVALVAIFTFVMIGSTNAGAPTFGIKGTLGMAKVTGDGTEDLKSTISFGGGGILRIAANDQLVVQPEVQIVTKGAKEDVSGTDEKITLTYLEVPLLLAFQPKMDGSVAPTFFAGPAIGILMSAKAAGEDIKDLFKSTDLGIVFGAGIGLKAGESGTIVIDGRYTMGLSNILDIPEGVTTDESVKNAVFSVNVAFLFGGGNGNGM